MLSYLLSQMDAYLSDKPFKRRWWTRRWIAHMTLQPPLTKDSPLWKRSKEELRLLRLFDLSPEELGQKIERYWKKPRWRRWFAAFGMNQKIAVWNYYQCCLAYQAVRPDKWEVRNLAGKHRPLLHELGLVLHQSHVKFERYLERRCRDVTWNEPYFLEAMKRYKEELKRTFLRKLNKSLKEIEPEGERWALKQQAEQEYQQVEALMLHYYQWRNGFFSRLFPPQLVPEIGIDAAQAEGNRVNPERHLVVCPNSQTESSSAPSTLPREENPPAGITSLRSAKEWIQTQRERLRLLLEEGALEKVETLLQASLTEIKTITELHLGCCETMILTIQGQHEADDSFLKYLDSLQGRLKPLLQGGMRLFHPDRMMNVTHSQAMWELITRYSQAYLEESRGYLERFNAYHRRIEAFYQQSQKGVQRESSLGEGSDLARRIHVLGESVKDLQQSFKAFKERVKESEAKLKESEAKRVQDKAEIEAEMEVKREKDRTEMDKRLKEAEAKLKEILDRLNPQQSVSTCSASEADLPESREVRFFKR